MLSGDVYASMQQMLLDGSLKPGSLLNRRQIAQILNVSVAPVLEAMLKLEHEGFLESFPRKGTQVHVFTEDDIKAHLLIKEALECIAARFYAGAVLRQNLPRLQPLAEQLDAMQDQANTMAFWQADVDFHKELVKLAENRLITCEYERIALPNVYHHVNKQITIREVSSHVLLVEQLGSDKPESAVKALQKHLRSGKGYYADYAVKWG
jgi:DNA-binding GntR family transcriptional regulator